MVNDSNLNQAYFSNPSSQPLYFFFFFHPGILFHHSSISPQYPTHSLQKRKEKRSESTAHCKDSLRHLLFKFQSLFLPFVGSQTPSISFFSFVSSYQVTHQSSAHDAPKSPGDIQGCQGPATGSCLYVHDDARHRDCSEEGSYRPEESGDCERCAVSAIVSFALRFCVFSAFWRVHSAMHVKDQVFSHPLRLVADDQGLEFWTRWLRSTILPFAIWAILFLCKGHWLTR